MKCLYCHETVQPEGETCPKCGLPLIEDTTLLRADEPEKPSVVDWLNDRKPVLLGAAGGFAAAAAIAIILMSSSAPRDPQVNAAMTPPPAAPAQPEPVRMASHTAIGSLTPALVGAPPAPAPKPEITPTLHSPVAPAPAPVVDEGDISAPPPLPANFEYDPALGIQAPPREHRRAPAPTWEPTPPAHTLAIDPFRERKPQYVTIVPLQNTAHTLSTTASGEPIAFTGE